MNIDEIRRQARIAVDPLILKLRQELYGSGVSYGRIQPNILPPTTVYTSNLDSNVAGAGYIKGITTLSGTTTIGTQQKELSFIGAHITTAGQRTTVRIEWDLIQNRPTTFPPSSHTHSLSDLQQSGAISGQVITWNGSSWVPSFASSGGNGIETTYSGTTLVGEYQRELSFIGAHVVSSGIRTTVTIDWNLMNGKPSTFPPSQHTHPLSDLQQSGAVSGQAIVWNGTQWTPRTITGVGSGISTTYSGNTLVGEDQRELSFVGAHVVSSGVRTTVTVDWNLIQNRPSTFPPSTHTHPLSQLEQSGASVGQVPSWNGTQWVPSGIGITTRNASNAAVGTNQTQLRFIGADLTSTGNQTDITISWDSIVNKPNTFTPGGAAGGDLSGNYPNPEVVGIRGRAVANIAPLNNQVLVWSSQNNRWEPQDQSGSSGDATSLQGRPVSSAQPTTGQALIWNGTQWAPDDVSGGAESVGSLLFLWQNFY